MVRAFIGIELDNSLKSDLKEQLRALRKSFPNLKWVDSKNYHLTLRFLGEVNNETITELKSIINNSAKGINAIKATINQLGAFPHPDHPRVIWLGLGRGKKEMVELHSSLEADIQKLGFSGERHSYTPHLTIARLKKRSSPEDSLKKTIKNYNWKERELVIDNITLFKSRLRPSGPIYSLLHQAKILKNP